MAGSGLQSTSIRGGPGRLLRSARADGRCVSGRCEPGAVRFNFLEAQAVTYRPTALNLRMN